MEGCFLMIIVFSVLKFIMVMCLYSFWFQVSHHPPMSAGHAENEHFTYEVTSKLKTKFLGNFLDVYPVGRLESCPCFPLLFTFLSCMRNLSLESDGGPMKWFFHLPCLLSAEREREKVVLYLFLDDLSYSLFWVCVTLHHLYVPQCLFFHL